MTNPEHTPWHPTITPVPAAGPVVIGYDHGVDKGMSVIYHGIGMLVPKNLKPHVRFIRLRWGKTFQKTAGGTFRYAELLVSLRVLAMADIRCEVKVYFKDDRAQMLIGSASNVEQALSDIVHKRGVAWD